MNIPMLDPELLQAFVTVADQRSFTRAAAALNRTQSAVSMQIKRLEERVGVELFHRTKANVDLDPLHCVSSIAVFELSSLANLRLDRVRSLSASPALSSPTSGQPTFAIAH